MFPIFLCPEVQIELLFRMAFFKKSPWNVICFLFLFLFLFLFYLETSRWDLIFKLSELYFYKSGLWDRQPSNPKDNLGLYGLLKLVIKYFT